MFCIKLSKIIFYYFCSKISQKRPKTAQRKRSPRTRGKKTEQRKRKRKRQQPRKYKQLFVDITLGKVWECRKQRRSRHEPRKNPPNLRNLHRNNCRRNFLPTIRVSDYVSWLYTLYEFKAWETIVFKTISIS